MTTYRHDGHLNLPARSPAATRVLAAHNRQLARANGPSGQARVDRIIATARTELEAHGVDLTRPEHRDAVMAACSMLMSSLASGATSHHITLLCGAMQSAATAAHELAALPQVRL